MSDGNPEVGVRPKGASAWRKVCLFFSRYAHTSLAGWLIFVPHSSAEALLLRSIKRR